MRMIAMILTWICITFLTIYFIKLLIQALVSFGAFMAFALFMIFLMLVVFMII